MDSSILRSIRVENGICWFDLEETIVLEILQRRDGQSFGSVPVLIFPRSLLEWIRKESFHGLKSGISFITCYNSVEVFQTIVNLDGDIINKIQEDILQTDQCLTVGIAHFWLIDQILLTLRQQQNLFLNFITWVSITFPVVGAVGLSWGDGALTLQDGMNVLIGSGGAGYMHTIRDRIKPRLEEQFRHWGWVFVRWKMGQGKRGRKVKGKSILK